MPIPAPDLRRTWLFGSGADARAHQAMQESGADALIVDLEDFTPPTRREEARRNLSSLIGRWRDGERIMAVRGGSSRGREGGKGEACATLVFSC